MGWGAALMVVGGVAALALLLYWLVWQTEGAYLGAGAVRRLYDWGATTYDGVKQFDPADEAAFLANPLFARLDETVGPRPLLLDVATGTARLPLALFAIPFFEGDVVGLDLSVGMLREAARKGASARARLHLLHHPAVPLPFADATFDAVTSLEALEFMPDRHAALREMARVLRPGGWLLVTNRIGLDARLMPGHTDSPAQFEQRLTALGLVEPLTRPWQEYYDLILARKPGEVVAGPRPTAAWLAALRCARCARAGQPPGEACPQCGGGWQQAADGLWLPR